MRPARDLLADLRRRGVTVAPTADGNLWVEPLDVLGPELVAELRQAKPEVLALLARVDRPSLRSLAGGIEADSTGREWYAQPVPTTPAELAGRNAETAQRYVDHLTRRLGLTAPSATVKAEQPERWARIVAAELAWDSALPSVRTLGDVEHVNGWLVTWVKEWEAALEERGRRSGE